MPDIAGFWSYTHADNDSVDNAIVKLAERVVSEFALLSGEQLRLFVDRDMEWGEQWQGRIDRELQETTFFIPIITPRYFQSEECRRELVKFKSAADRFGVKQLLLPIYYVTVPEMEEPEPQDELMTFVKSIQRKDMREIRLAEESDALHRKLVNQLVTRILEISRKTEGLSVPGAAVIEAGLEASPTQQPDFPMDGVTNPSAAVATAVDPDATPTAAEEGSLDVLAAGEEALADWVQAVRRLNLEIQSIGSITKELTPEMGDAESFAQQLAVANKLAVQLDAPAENIQEIAQDYSTQLIKVDPALQTLIGNARTDSAVKEQEGTKELFGAILEMVRASRNGAAGIEELIESMEEPAATSRELRQRVRRIQTSLRNIIDGQKVLLDWEEQIRALYGDALDPED